MHTLLCTGHEGISRLQLVNLEAQRSDAYVYMSCLTSNTADSVVLFELFSVSFLLFIDFIWELYTRTIAKDYRARAKRCENSCSCVLFFFFFLNKYGLYSKTFLVQKTKRKKMSFLLWDLFILRINPFCAVNIRAILDYANINEYSYIYQNYLSYVSTRVQSAPRIVLQIAINLESFFFIELFVLASGKAATNDVIWAPPSCVVLITCPGYALYTYMVCLYTGRGSEGARAVLFEKRSP